MLWCELWCELCCCAICAAVGCELCDVSCAWSCAVSCAVGGSSELGLCSERDAPKGSAKCATRSSYEPSGGNPQLPVSTRMVPMFDEALRACLVIQLYCTLPRHSTVLHNNPTELLWF